MTRQRNKERQKEKRKSKGQTGKDYEQVGLQKAPPHSENAKSRNSKQDFFFKKQPSSSL
jgi:hypothetical protein